jgi:hypothetical protein
MNKWDKLNKEFDEALDSMTSEDWKSWYERFKQKQINKNKMGLIKDKADSLKNEPYHKRLRRWLKFKLWVWKHELNKSE